MRTLRTHRILGVAAALLVSACDYHVTNPGPVQDDFLDRTAAFPAIVNGAGRNLSDALNYISYTGAAVAGELHPAGSTGSFGITVQQQNGKLNDDEVNDHWVRAQQARWTAEQGLERLRTGLKTDFGKSKDAAQLLLWAAYSNRLLGESMCDAVIDGGAKQPYTVFLERAEAQFTEAITVATAAAQPTMATAATAGRASVRALRNNWAAAVTDAATVPNAFVYQMPYNAIDIDQYNRIYWAGANQPYRAHTVWHTFYEEYYKSSKDPRVAWDQDAKNPTGDAAVGNLGRVPWYFQTKFKVRDAGINLSSGWEMRLLEAEAKLIANDVAGAATLINGHRVALGLAPWPASNATDAWTALKRERGIELWLEARRLGDLRRWAAASRPGLTDVTAGRDVCFPISRSEKETNPNVAGG